MSKSHMTQYCMKFLIIGCGSIGRRHLRNLITLGYHDVHVFDPQLKVLDQVASEFGVITHSDLDEALEASPVAVILANPTAFHIPVATKSAEIGAHLFIEKPLSHSMEGVSELLTVVREHKLVTMVAYSLRFYQGILLMWKLLDEGEIGKALHVHAEAGQYLPDWRPGTDYRKQYSARSDLGGGVILDLSHEIDYLLWLFGPVQYVSARKAKVSDLEIDVEDTADILMEHSNGVMSSVHLDYLQRIPARSCKVVGSEGTLIWDFASNSVRVYSSQNKTWHEHTYDVDRNEMYINELKHFVDCIQEGNIPLISLEDGLQALQVVLAAIQASDSGQRQKVNYEI